MCFYMYNVLLLVLFVFPVSCPKGRTKRSSVNRPVLQLQVKPATLERVRRRLGSSSGAHVITSNTINSLARDSGIYGVQI